MSDPEEKFLKVLYLNLVAETIKPQLPEGAGFILFVLQPTHHCGQTFAHEVDYISNLERADALEVLRVWQREHAGTPMVSANKFN